MKRGTHPRRTWPWVLVAIAGVGVLAGAGVVTYLATQDDEPSTIVSGGDPDGDTDDPVGDEGTADEGTGDEGTGDEGTGDEGTGDEGTGDEGTDGPAGTDQDGEGPVDGVTFSDALLEEAIAAAEADPLTGLPTRDAVTTAALQGELAAAGFDMTGTVVTAYPTSAAPSFVLLETDDDSALVAGEDGSGEAFVLALLDSPAVAAAGVDQLVLRHSSTDETGPYVVTFMVPLDDMRAAAAGGAELGETVRVQVERP